MIKNLNSLSPLDLLNWLKSPNNIFVGIIKIEGKIIYSNIFSSFEGKVDDLLESLVLTNLDVLKDKEIGYITADQRNYAEILDSLRGRCYTLSSRQVDLFPFTPLGFENTLMRMWKARFIRESLKQYTDLSIGKQCVVKSPNIKIVKKLGVGGFGVVYLVSDLLDNHRFALKMTIEKVNNEALKNPYSVMQEAWDEINLLRPYLSSLVERGICQNFCYMYESFICNTCDFEGQKQRKGVPCANIALELANGTLHDWDKVDRTEDEFLVALFQCMAGIHAGQKYYQLSNEDIKDINILVGHCNPGGYWEYVIMGKSYYLPNMGNVFLTNDYGIGFSYDLSIPVCNKLTIAKTRKRTSARNADFRPFIVVDDKLTLIRYNNILPRGLVKRSGDRLYPLICKLEGENETRYTNSTIINNIQECHKYTTSLTSDQIKTLEKNALPRDSSNPLFFSNSDVVPYLEMFVDTQDVLRMFIGNITHANTDQLHSKRRNVHSGLNKRLEKYLLTGGNSSMLKVKYIADIEKFKPSQIMAGYFIKEFFGDMYSHKPPGNLIQRFVI